MFSKENSKSSTRCFQTEYIIFYKKFSSLSRKMDFYLTIDISIFLMQNFGLNFSPRARGTKSVCIH